MTSINQTPKATSVANLKAIFYAERKLRIAVMLKNAKKRKCSGLKLNGVQMELKSMMMILIVIPVQMNAREKASKFVAQVLENKELQLIQALNAAQLRIAKEMSLATIALKEKPLTLETASKILHGTCSSPSSVDSYR